ncbi:hypothetical protein CEUSTIGMA_g8129.t1 [Chlamydomonas eustigma]|uniref:Laccase n=1 Tax=Chlamydomonas eustigma TaxID=1157962 RepID=A0A250XC81_9CHLO|nr:hypothetical protein CEUSTIGMA_g8129.t1 [Chlamydomonas eustigma]|eukprot:GAX80694.1 hypothetical protein CEUSTIGMA_g8129.t1 [Chlamydomonas eustigma]
MSQCTSSNQSLQIMLFNGLRLGILRLFLCIFWTNLFLHSFASCQNPVIPYSIGPPVLKGRRFSGGLIFFDLNVTVAKGGPDCYPRDVVLVNGHFQPSIQVYVNDTVHIKVRNQLPKDFPEVSSGISIHWHGLYMWNNATWYDGTPYIMQCPIAIDRTFTYKFLVNEIPGTYIWHDHSSALRSDGLQGSFIVRSSDPDQAYIWTNTSVDYTLFISDWYHNEGNVMAMQLNRPMVQANVTANSGSYRDIPAPDALLINGMGFYGDCNMNGLTLSLGENGVLVPVCGPQLHNLTHPVPGNSGGKSGGCSHQVFDVVPGESYFMRIVNAGMATYVTICFEGHNVTVVTGDVIPMAPVDFQCIDLNVAQRYDVVLTAYSDDSYIGSSFWISVHSQHRPASPSTYAVLRYVDPAGSSTTDSSASSADSSLGISEEMQPSGTSGSAVAGATWPSTPPPQPGLFPWTLNETLAINANDGMLGYLDGGYLPGFWDLYLKNGAYESILYGTADRVIVLNQTSPVLSKNGVLRWAMDNVAMPTDPPCEPLMRTLKRIPTWLQEHTLNTSNASAVEALMIEATSRGEYASNKIQTPSVFLDGMPTPKVPIVGLHLAQIKLGQVVDIVINNRPGSEGNPEYADGPSATYLHSIHLHGHKFWVLGMGTGVYSDSLKGTLNFFNPMLRDTMTLPAGGWLVIRFLANNAGIWPLHCHILWHAFMGQQVYIVEGDASEWPPVPKGMPACTQKCIYNFAPFTQRYINKTYGSKNSYQLPQG